jgi:hypothetical protein
MDQRADTAYLIQAGMWTGQRKVKTVKDTISYLNTDLDLTSADDLTSLAAAFEKKGISPLYVTHGEDGLWYATFETDFQHTEPEPNISAMLTAIESLRKPLQKVWASCIRRRFDIGYDCGRKPRQLRHGLSSKTLGRIAAVDAALWITLYPPATKKNIVKAPRSPKRK